MTYKECKGALSRTVVRKARVAWAVTQALGGKTNLDEEDFEVVCNAVDFFGDDVYSFYCVARAIVGIVVSDSELFAKIRKNPCIKDQELYKTIWESLGDY